MQPNPHTRSCRTLHFIIPKLEERVGDFRQRPSRQRTSSKITCLQDIEAESILACLPSGAAAASPLVLGQDLIQQPTAKSSSTHLGLLLRQATGSLTNAQARESQIVALCPALVEEEAPGLMGDSQIAGIIQAKAKKDRMFGLQHTSLQQIARRVPFWVCCSGLLRRHQHLVSDH